MYANINKKGFTLIEVVLAIALIATVITIGVNTYIFSNRTFKEAEKSTIIQNDMRYASKYISNQLRTASKIELISNPIEPEKNNNLISVDGGSIIHKYIDKETKEPVTKTILDSSLSEYKYDISFGRVKGSDGLNRKNVIEFELSVNESDYTLKSDIAVQNMGDEDEITGSSSRHIYYLNSFLAPEEDNPEIPGGSNCFTRSAMVGTPMEPAVILLRNFRDSHMLTNKFGIKLSSFYYKTSPAIASLVSKSETVKLLVRVLLIPFIFMAAIFTVHGGFTYAVITIMQIILSIFLYKQLKKINKSIA